MHYRSDPSGYDVEVVEVQMSALMSPNGVWIRRMLAAYIVLVVLICCVALSYAISTGPDPLPSYDLEAYL